jgi:hypothetical protein
MSDNNGWSGKPGVPLNPERDGAHWLKGYTEDACMWQDEGWYIPGYSHKLDAEAVAARYSYIGPCLTTAEVEARVKEAVDLGRDIATRELDPQIAMLIPWQTAIEDALSNWCDAVADDETPADALQRLIRLEVMAALDPAVSQSAADLVAKAKREALEEAARWHDEQAAEAQKLSDMKVSALDSKVWGDYATNHREYAAAIRALKGEGNE